MSHEKQGGGDRLQLNVPIRVIGVSAEAGEFTEDTHAHVVNHGGARILLTHPVAAGETIRIIDLENHSEADFRVVGPTNPRGTKVGEWAVECAEPGRSMWGIELPSSRPVGELEAGTMLECRACRQQGLMAVTLMEVDVLGSTGLIIRECNHCGRQTYWAYAETNRRPREILASEPVAPPPRGPAAKKESEKRVHKRVGMKLPILVRNEKHGEEIGKTDNVSKGGVAVALAMELAVGDTLNVVCPYSPGGQAIEQKAEVRWRSPFPFGGMRTYGLKYVE